MKTRQNANGAPGERCVHPHTPHTAHTRHADTPRGPCVQCAHRVERDERCAELITNKRTELPGGVGSPVHTYHSHGLTQTIRRQRPGRVKGVLSPAAMACGRWHATWLGCLAHASAAASRSRVQASPATALGVYQRAMSSLARASRAAASLRSTLRHGPPAYAARLTVLDAAAAQEGDVRRVHGDPSTERIVAARICRGTVACAFVRSYGGVGRCSPGVVCRAVLVGLPCVQASWNKLPEL